MCPSLIEIGSKTAEKNSAQTNKQTNKQTNRHTGTTKIMVTWPWTNTVVRAHSVQHMPPSRRTEVVKLSLPAMQQVHASRCVSVNQVNIQIQILIYCTTKGFEASHKLLRDTILYRPLYQSASSIGYASSLSSVCNFILLGLHIVFVVS